MENDKKTEEVYFINGTSPNFSESVELHKGKSSNEISRQLSEVKEDWQKIVSQIKTIISGTNETFKESTDFKMEEVEIKLAFTAKGKLAFIAEAGAEASITIKLKNT